MDIEFLRDFFGLCVLVNMGILLLSIVLLGVFKDLGSRLHSQFFGIEQGEIRLTYFRWLGYYKLLIIVFNLVPYITLSIMV